MNKMRTSVGGVLAVLALGSGLAISAAAFSGSSADASRSTTPAGSTASHDPAATSGHPAPTTTSAADPSPPSAAPLSVRPPSDTAPPETEPSAAGASARRRFSQPADAAAHLYRAWEAGSRQQALLSAKPAAVDALFARSPAGSRFTGSECEDRGAGDFDCYFDGEGESLEMGVVRHATAGFKVASVTFIAHPPSEGQSPQATVTPGSGPVGATIHIEGPGFVGDPWAATGAPLYLVGGTDGCALYAAAEHSVEVDADGHLSGDFVIPTAGDCRFADHQATVTPGRYQIAYACTACLIGEVEVTG